MIKLKDIVDDVLQEVRESRRGSGERDFTIEIDGEHIPALSLPNDTIEIFVTVLFDYDPGYGPRGMFGTPEHSDSGEGPSVEITGHDIAGITTKSERGMEREVDYNMLHPLQKKAIDDLVDAYIHKNTEDISNTILNGYDE